MKLWDATPIRATGKSKKKGFGMIGNQQKNFFAADYLFFSNEFALEEVQRDYMLENIAKSKALISGYPRNEILFDKEKRAQIRSKHEMDGLQTFFYSPVRRIDEKTIALKAQREQMIEQLWELDKVLSDNQRVYAKVQKEMADLIDWDGMTHVVKVPSGYSTYEFLGAVDGLITDYSGMMLDYAVTRRPIFLFQYDKNIYLENNSFAVSLEEFPFPKTETVQELAAALTPQRNYDDSEFLNRFCPKEQPGAAKAICAKFILEEDSPLVEVKPIADNGKKNVVVERKNKRGRTEGHSSKTGDL